MEDQRNWIPVSIPKALYEKAKKEYEKEGFPNVSQFIQHAIRMFLQKEKEA